MKRRLILDLGLFEPRCGDLDWSEGILFNALKTLAFANLQEMECGQIPPLYASRVRYKPETPAEEELFASCSRVVAVGHGDCDDLAAYRIAELWRAGERARFVVKKATLLRRGASAGGAPFFVIREETMVGEPSNRTPPVDLVVTGPNPTLARLAVGGLLYHVLVQRADGSLEDPSEILGMGRAA